MGLVQLELRCSECPNILEYTNLNEVRWNSNWALRFTYDGDLERAVCPEHGADAAPGMMRKWEVFCTRCDWIEDFDSLKEAEDEKEFHECDFWDHDRDHIEIIGPEQLAERAERDEESRIRWEAQKKADKKRADFLSSLERAHLRKRRTLRHRASRSSGVIRRWM